MKHTLCGHAGRRITVQDVEGAVVITLTACPGQLDAGATPPALSITLNPPTAGLLLDALIACACLAEETEFNRDVAIAAHLAGVEIRP